MAKPEATRVIAYHRVSKSSEGKGAGGGSLGLSAQSKAIKRVVKDKGWKIVASFTDDGQSGTRTNRPGLNQALALLAAGDAEALVCARLDRLSRSLPHAATLLEIGDQQGWQVVAADMPGLAGDAASTFTKQVIIASGQLTRSLISENTKNALAIARERGVRLGRRRELNPATERLIRDLRSAGMPLRKIVSHLVDENVRTATGKRWHLSTVVSVLHREAT